MHFDLQCAVALTAFTSAALDIEGESALLISSRLSLRCVCKDRSYIGEHSRICRRIGARRSAYRRLVDIDHFIDIFDTAYFVVLAGHECQSAESACHTVIQNRIDERRFSRTAHTGYAYEFSERKIHGYILQVVFSCSDNSYKTTVSRSSHLRHSYNPAVRKVIACD